MSDHTVSDSMLGRFVNELEESFIALILGLGVTAQVAHLRRLRGGEELDGALGGDLEPDRAGLRRGRTAGDGEEPQQGAMEELDIVGGQGTGVVAHDDDSDAVGRTIP